MSSTTVRMSDGASFSVTTEPSLQGMRAYGLAFDNDANVIAETSSRQFIGYCKGCVVQSVVDEMLPYTDYATVEVHYDCTCDD